MHSRHFFCLGPFPMQAIVLASYVSVTLAFSSNTHTKNLLHRGWHPFIPAHSRSNCGLQTCARVYMSERSEPVGGVLQGQRVLITGGGRGIGRAIALICAEEGADVAVVSRTHEEVQEVAEEVKRRFGTRSLALCADVTDEAQVSQAVSKVVSGFGGIDILVNNAGAGCEKVPAFQQSAEAFRRLLDVNVISAFIVSSQVLNRCMLAQKSGSIINISSRAGKVCQLTRQNTLQNPAIMATVLLASASQSLGVPSAASFLDRPRSVSSWIHLSFSFIPQTSASVPNRPYPH
jgi:hypothetical protein